MEARLVLEDGSVFRGFSFGYESPVAGEVVFNTGMTGYPESLTDPSYAGQILTLTYPLIGNYGVPEHSFENMESGKIQVTGLIISDYSKAYSHWNSRKSLSEWLIEHRVPAICGIDTRALTKKLREHGVMLGKIIYVGDIAFLDPNKRNLVADVSVKAPKLFGKGKRIVLVDCGAKNSIISGLVSTGLEVLLVPWDYDFNTEEYAGLFISNGPGDPKMCKAAIDNIRFAMKEKKPIMGICLGNQLLGLAAGANTYKLKFGHRGQNQPCIDVKTGRCYITSQNHGFAIDTKTLPSGWKAWFTNANDETNEGIYHSSGLWCSVQFHPEAMPGPTDTHFLFEKFKGMLK
jgi:carbamoyl-phosphate synthase small subunit